MFVRQITSIVIVALLSMSYAQASADEPMPKRYALLVAVTTYEHAEMNKPRLDYPEIDAKDVGQFLQDHGYEVDYLLGRNATKTAIESKLNGLAKKGNEQGVVVLGFWGHGVEYEGSDESMFCPFDSTIRTAVDSKGNKLFDKNGQLMIEPDPKSLVGMSTVLQGLKLSAAGNRVLLADCCRESPNRARGRAFGSKTKLTDLPGNTAALFACSELEQAFEDKSWGHGAFTKCLLDLLPRLTSGDGDDVASITGRLKRDVSSLVDVRSSGRDHQTVHPIFNGAPELKLKITALPSLVTNSIGMKLKLIASGEFVMGSPADEADRSEQEGPQHRVRISKAFYMGVTEVTQGQWFSVMQTRPWQGEEYVQEGDNYPAVYVSWDDAVEYCERLSLKEGVTYRLPTEAEWEYACRGGKSTAYSFGNDPSQLSDYGWWGGIVGDGNAKTEQYAHTVGSKKANPYGLFDMHGNVFEWCEDVHDGKSYASRSGTTVDPLSTSGSESRVLRGGSWALYSWNARSAYRLRNSPGSRNYLSGFRVVR